MVTKRNFIGLCIGFAFLILGIGTTLMGQEDLGSFLIGFANYIIPLFGLIMLLAESTIIGTLYGKIIMFTYFGASLFFFFVEAIWIEAANFSFLSLLVYLVTYLIWFSKKKKIGHLDILKIAWVLSFAVLPLNYFYPNLPEEISWANHIFLMLLIFDFLAIAYFGPKPFFLERSSPKIDNS